MDPLSMLLQNPPPRWQGKKGSEKPKQVKEFGGEENSGPMGEVTGNLQQAMTLLESVKRSFPENSEPSSQLAGILNQLTVLLNRTQGISANRQRPMAEEPPAGTASPPSPDILQAMMAGPGGMSGMGAPSPGSSVQSPFMQ